MCRGECPQRVQHRESGRSRRPGPGRKRGGRSASFLPALGGGLGRARAPAPGGFKRTRGARTRPTGQVSTRRAPGGRARPRPHAAARRPGEPRAAAPGPGAPAEGAPEPSGAGRLCSSLGAMTNLPPTPSPGEELITTPMLQPTRALSPEAEASTALIAVVITVVFLTLISVVTLIFFYLYKNKGSYVTYEPAEGEPGAILQMESDAAKRDKEEYFI